MNSEGRPTISSLCGDATDDIIIKLLESYGQLYTIASTSDTDEYELLGGGVKRYSNSAKGTLKVVLADLYNTMRLTTEQIENDE